jgi:hypothetical protein
MKINNLFKTTIFVASFATCFIFGGKAQATLHSSGSVVISQGTIYRISENRQTLEGFDTPEKYFSYRYDFSQAVPATPEDLALPRSVIPWGDGKLFVEQGVGYQVSGGTKHGFASQDAFIGQGFKFSQAKIGTLNLPIGNNIESASQAHLAGTFVIDTTGTVWYMSDTQRRGVASIDHLSSWGLAFDEVVPANANDLNKPIGAALPFRAGFEVSYKRKTISTSRGNFTVDILTADLSQGNIQVVTDTGNDNDCANNCTVKPLLTYINENGGFAGINGSYFCPVDYPECASKINTFYWKVYNSALGKMINSNSGIKDDQPFMAFDAGGAVRFFSRYQDLALSGFALTAGISNEPLLIQNGQIVVTENMLDDKQRTVKSTRGGLGMKGQTIYAVVARSSTVFDLAFIMQAIGADNAFNLDGGGSSALVFEGAYKIGPGRSIPNALIFMRK